MRPETVPVHRRRSQSKKLFLAFSALLLVGCNDSGEHAPAKPLPRSTIESNPNSPQTTERTVTDTETALLRAADTKDEYFNCMERYFPNYRDEFDQYGERYMGPLREGQSENHPAWEGCASERENFYELDPTLR